MHRSAFTLIEILIVIAIAAILSVVVILALNPAQLLMQSRDSNRVSDMTTLNDALGIYEAQGGTSLGNPNTVYVSIPAPTATSTAGDQCQGLGLLVLPANYTYQCAASSTYRLTNGTGWIPVNFSTIAGGSPLGQLPTDPINTSSSRLYYTYDTNGTQYEVTSVMESQKYQLGGSNDVIGPDGGTLASVYEKGSKLGLEPLDYGDSSLVGLWTFDEGTGTVAYDYSGNNWNGTQAGTNGYYSAGKIGSWAGDFDGSTDYVNGPNSASLTLGTGDFTLIGWAYNATTTSGYHLVAHKAGYGTGPGYGFGFNHTGINCEIETTADQEVNVGTVTVNQWHQIACVFSRASQIFSYSDGSLITSTTYSSENSSVSNTTPLILGTFGGTTFILTGLIDDVRIYNRALTAAQVAAMYNGGK